MIVFLIWESMFTLPDTADIAETGFYCNCNVLPDGYVIRRLMFFVVVCASLTLLVMIESRLEVNMLGLSFADNIVE